MPVRNNALNCFVSSLTKLLHKARSYTLRTVYSAHGNSDSVLHVLIGQRIVSITRRLRYLSCHCFQPVPTEMVYRLETCFLVCKCSLHHCDTSAHHSEHWCNGKINSALTRGRNGRTRFGKAAVASCTALRATRKRPCAQPNLRVEAGAHRPNPSRRSSAADRTRSWCSRIR